MNGTRQTRRRIKSLFLSLDDFFVLLELFILFVKRLCFFFLIIFFVNSLIFNHDEEETIPLLPLLEL